MSDFDPGDTVYHFVRNLHAVVLECRPDGDIQIQGTTGENTGVRFIAFSRYLIFELNQDVL